jgi:hypothetical protein
MAARRGMWGVARIVRLITSIVVGLIVVGIILVLLEGNRDNAIVDWLVGAADFLSEPFQGIFTPDGRKAMVAVNWGLAPRKETVNDTCLSASSSSGGYSG